MDEATSLCWAEQEFGQARLGNALRTRRAVALAAAVMRTPAGTVTGVLSGPAEREGAFRFVENPEVAAGALADSSHMATVRRCREPITIVAVDQTTLSVTDSMSRKGFGPCGGRFDDQTNKRGVEVMSALAVSPNGATLGLLAQSWLRRSDKRSPPYHQDDRPLQERESDLWLQAIEQAQSRFDEAGSNSRPWFQLDRGGDCWRVFDFADHHDVWLTVRSTHDRRLWDSHLTLHKRMAVAPCRGTLRVFVPARRPPAQNPRPARIAQLQIRYEPVVTELTDEAGNKIPVELTAVHVSEQGRHADRIRWCLLTTHPVKTFADAKLVVFAYAQRWRIEDFHRAWKSGACDVESSQLRSPGAFCRWATILAAVATRIEQLKHLLRTMPDVPAIDHLSRLEQDAAIVLSYTRKFKPGDDLTLGQVIILIAQAGGYTGKSSGGPPGTITLTRGMDRVQAAVAAIQRLNNKT
jgi:hypothetical protein